MVEGNSGEIGRTPTGMARMAGGVFITSIALWSGVWLAITALLEWWHRGFVVHYVNTRLVWLVFAAAGALHLFFRSRLAKE